MSALVNPRLGFHFPKAADDESKEEVKGRISRIGVAAARNKFTPEFVNRLDKIVVFKPLGREELSLVEIELDTVQQRLQKTANGVSFEVDVTEAACDFLLNEGTDLRYGARHLKRAIERHMVQPLSNLIASGQIHRGHLIRVSHREDSSSLLFFLDIGASESWRTARPVAA